MKQKDYAFIAVIVIISGAISLVLSKAIISTDSKKQEAEVVEPITADFTQPSEKYFNEESTNPTYLIQINENKNQNPFNNSN